MRIGVISDTHLYRGEDLIERLWGHLHGLDLVLHAGDVVSREVIEVLSKIAPVEGVAGNMDTPEVCRIWPNKRVVEVGPFRIGMMHGSGPGKGLDLRVLQEFSWVDAIVFGHSHQPLIQRYGGILLINPGSPTDPRQSPWPSMAIIDARDRISAELIRLPR